MTRQMSVVHRLDLDHRFEENSMDPAFPWCQEHINHPKTSHLAHRFEEAPLTTL